MLNVNQSQFSLNVNVGSNIPKSVLIQFNGTPIPVSSTKLQIMDQWLSQMMESRFMKNRKKSKHLKNQESEES